MGTTHEKANLDAPRTFYDPHPGGILGAAAPLPEAVRRVAAELDGKTMSLRRALELLAAAGIGTPSVVPDHGFIKLEVGGGQGARHVWRVIRYR